MDTLTIKHLGGQWHATETPYGVASTRVVVWQPEIVRCCAAEGALVVARADRLPFYRANAGSGVDAIRPEVVQCDRCGTGHAAHIIVADDWGPEGWVRATTGKGTVHVADRVSDYRFATICGEARVSSLDVARLPEAAITCSRCLAATQGD